MWGELATEVKYKNRKFFVIMVLPDAMGKLSPHRMPTSEQKKVSYLVWNRNSYRVMTNELGLSEVQLIEPVDPLKGYEHINKTELQNRGFHEVFYEENLCVVKLSGSGGDPYLINTVITSLWNRSKVSSIVFPGQKRTKRKILKRYDQKSRVIKQSLDEAEFYNLARNMQPNTQMLLTYPSEQFKHVMVLSKEQRRLKVVWLPPRGEHEVNNLIEYIEIARLQNEITTICIPHNYHQYMNKKLNKAGLKQYLDYQLVSPENLEKQHFESVPDWTKNENIHKKMGF